MDLLQASNENQRLLGEFLGVQPYKPPALVQSSFLTKLLIAYQPALCLSEAGNL